MYRFKWIFCFASIALSSSLSEAVQQGVPASTNEFPFYVEIRDSDDEPYCGGTIISESHVLTAAHCLDDDIYRSSIIAGLTDASKKEPLQRGFVKAYEIHETFEKNKGLRITSPQDRYKAFVDDIGLVHLKQPFHLDGKLVNAIPISVDTSYPSGSVILLGRGLTSEESDTPPDVLHKVELAAKPFDECSSNHHNIGGIPPLSFCADISETNKGACSGDSGGPIIRRVDGKDELIGVVNFAGNPNSACAISNRPTVMLRVSEYKNWIESTKANISK